MRDGKGIFKTSDGKVYEGGWSQNKIHGKGRERFATGECFLVYYKNGCRIEALASRNTVKDPSIKEVLPVDMALSGKGMSMTNKSKSRSSKMVDRKSGKKSKKDCVIF